jgi:hypothetical protein
MHLAQAGQGKPGPTRFRLDRRNGTQVPEETDGEDPSAANQAQDRRTAGCSVPKRGTQGTALFLLAPVPASTSPRGAGIITSRTPRLTPAVK